jgi:HSP20 family molecular chaperone IbpA
MSRASLLNSPLLLGFEPIERVLERVAKGSAEGYPPYNIEQLSGEDGAAVALRLTFAVAGFTRDQLDVSVEDNQLTIRGRQDEDDKARVFLHRGIAARQFQRSFVLADGIEVRSAELKNGLLSIDLERPAQDPKLRRIDIRDSE